MKLANRASDASREGFGAVAEERRVQRVHHSADQHDGDEHGDGLGQARADEAEQLRADEERSPGDATAWPPSSARLRSSRWPAQSIAADDSSCTPAKSTPFAAMSRLLRWLRFIVMP